MSEKSPETEQSADKTTEAPAAKTPADVRKERESAGERKTYTLIAPHRDRGRDLEKGDPIDLFPHQAKRLRREKKIK